VRLLAVVTRSSWRSTSALRACIGRVGRYRVGAQAAAKVPSPNARTAALLNKRPRYYRCARMASQRSRLGWALAAMTCAAVACGRPPGSRPRPGWAATEVELERRCQRGELDGCAELGRTLVGPRRDATDLERGLVLLEVACGRDDVRACTALGNAYARRIDGPGANERARELLDRGCSGAQPTACTGLGKLGGVSAQGNTREVRALYRKACDSGDAEGCELLGESESGDDFAGDPTEAAVAFDEACRRGRLSSCHRLATERLLDPRKQDEALQSLRSICDRGHAPSCLAAALALAPTVARRPDCARALPVAVKACQLEKGPGCAIADACQLGDPRQRATAVDRLEHACERHDALACLYWADARPDGGDDRRRSAYRIACEDATDERVGALSCGRWAALELVQGQTRGARQNALHILERTCDASSGQACCDLAAAYAKGIETTPTPARAAELRARACELEERRCCSAPANRN
jgi:TPR repeat protein